MDDRAQRITRMATAIANARGGRHGVPAIVNVLDAVPADLRAAFMEDAEAALDSLGEDPPTLPLDACDRIGAVLDAVLDHVVLTHRPDAGLPSDVRVSEIIPQDLAERAAGLLMEIGL